MFDSPWFAVLAIVLAFLVVLFFCYQTGSNYEKFKKEGIRTEAKVLSKEKIGASGTGNTRFSMVVEFNTEEGVVTAKAKRFFTPEDLIKVMRNNTVVIYYLPTEPKKILMMPGEME